MAVHTLSLSGSRQLLLDILRTSGDYAIEKPFAALVPAFDAGERQMVETLSVGLASLGCIEFCCVGPQAEQLHDSLDGIIEDGLAAEIVTTWHMDAFDACEYFLCAAGGRAPTLLALISSHPDLSALLEREAGKA